MSLTLACPLQAAQDALLLLRTGRADMACVVLETLPGLLLAAENERLRSRVAELEAGLAERRALLGRLAPQVAVARKPLTRSLAKPHERLAAALADGRVTAERAAELLKVDPWHLFEIAGGRVGLARSAWKKLFAELSIEEDRT